MARKQKNTSRKKTSSQPLTVSPRLADMAGLCLLFCALFSFFSLLQVLPIGVGSYLELGPLGEGVGVFLYGLFGVAALSAPIIIGVFALRLIQLEDSVALISLGRFLRIVVLTVFSLCFAATFIAICQMWLGKATVQSSYIQSVGLVGTELGVLLVSHLGAFGAFLLAITLFLAALIWLFDGSVLGMSQGLLYFSSDVFFHGREISSRFVEYAIGFSQVTLKVLQKISSFARETLLAALATPEKREPVQGSQRKRQRKAETEPSVLSDFKQSAMSDRSAELDSEEEDNDDDALYEDIEQEAQDDEREERRLVVERFVPRSTQKTVISEDAKFNIRHRDYVFPPLDVLTAAKGKSESADREDYPLHDERYLAELSKRIEQKLADFNINGQVTHAHPGPVVTLFEFEPASGVKVGRIASLQDDLAMSLRASSIRIIAPIPQRGTVGIEIPNPVTEVVRLRELFETDEWMAERGNLTVPLGKDIYGRPFYADIAKMPHLLMAGATGTGKSVSINALLLSLLYRCSPSELGLILIDPKILELSVYEDIPHLRVPVVTEPKKAKAVLKWAVEEMDRRYRLMKRYGVRNLDGYNAIANGDAGPDKEKQFDEEEIIELGDEELVEEGELVAEAEDGTEVEQEETDADTSIAPQQLEALSKLVIVIDELADLMMTSGKEVEDYITRLAQKARAAGIHLIVATQRPSVDVITGLIKANFPARVSFRVSSRIDSRTILDTGGAEKLLGNGDMLFMKPGNMHPLRLHGAFVSDGEVARVAAFLREHSEPQYDSRILESIEKELSSDDEPNDGQIGSAEDYDPLYDRAVEFVIGKGQASTSMIQRAFRIGYNRAARIVDAMEQAGVVGPIDGARPRQVLVQSGVDRMDDHS